MKLRTHKATAKRVRSTKTGKLMKVQSASSHLLTHKSDRTRVKSEVSHADAKKVRRLAPYI